MSPGRRFTLVLVSLCFFHQGLWAQPEISEETAINIAPESYEDTLRNFGVNLESKDLRSTYFFDTAKKELAGKGIILRFQRESLTSTVKVRAAFPEKTTTETFINQIIKKIPADAYQSPTKFKKGIKCEIDTVLNENVEPASKAFSCSFQMTIKADLAQSALARPTQQQLLFTAEQWAFLQALVPIEPSLLQSLESYGPVEAAVWQTTVDRRKLTFELWLLPGVKKRYGIFQVSTKFPHANSEAELASLQNFLHGSMLTFRKATSKTSFVLDHYREARAQEISERSSMKDQK